MPPPSDLNGANPKSKLVVVRESPKKSTNANQRDPDAKLSIDLNNPHSDTDKNWILGICSTNDHL